MRSSRWKQQYACLAAAILVLAGAATSADERRNYFNDPFVQVTRGIADCPVPEGPLMTESEMRAEAHSRAERGTRCYLSGRCRLPNSYAYDREIIPRVEKAILADGGYADSSIWVQGQARVVWLKGCVRTRKQSQALEQLVRKIEDVERVINQLELKR